MKGVAVTLLACTALSGSVFANRYVCDVAPLINVEAELYDIDYDERKQQREIDDFNELLDAAIEASAGNNSCGDLEFHNSDVSSHSVLVGGCENDIFTGGDFGTLGGGQRNWIYTDAKISSIGGGYHNIATGDWASIGGGVKNKAYSNYATVLGGYLGKCNSKFASIGGGSRNTVAGRFGLALGTKVSVTGDYSMGMGFSSANCYVRGTNTLGICADSILISGANGDVDLVTVLEGSRRLSEASKSVDELKEESVQLEEELRSKIEALLAKGGIRSGAVDFIESMLSSL